MTKRDPQLNIRLPQELKARLQIAAERNKRSVNAEAVAAIERAVIDAERVVTHENGDIEITLTPFKSKYLVSKIESIKHAEEILSEILDVVKRLEQLNKH
ncbi:Arc family DNA-binding protein [Xenorhabdus indica]|uniref:Arc family DNA-binding protein n=1 Tax=Xenorhabdus indica TaxID=333964 RepID=UPI001656EC7C|nr:Arc family DNA-binding protein [Xenorhabdus indica]MBC8947088.1 Rha family transcriptional regulator [Xenorhabdus indica]